MTKSIRDIAKKRVGRPKTTGLGTGIMVRGHEDFLRPLDAWIAKQKDQPSRPEAIRRLVELALAVKTPVRPVSQPGRKLRAQELATKEIEKIIDPAAPPEERAQRRRRLTKGPEEFQEVRVDRPKTGK
jgi:hypothetical protein